jgi:hypothetical protein
LIIGAGAGRPRNPFPGAGKGDFGAHGAQNITKAG